MGPIMTRQQKHPKPFNTRAVLYLLLSLSAFAETLQTVILCVPCVNRYISFTFAITEIRIVALIVLCSPKYQLINRNDAAARLDYFPLLNASAFAQ